MIKLPDDFSAESAAQQGFDNFCSGLNCAQAVAATFAPIFADEIDRDTLLRMIASMGGGMSRLRLTCGVVSAMALFAGLECGIPTPAEPSERARNYALVQQLAHRFEAEHGSLSCATLLGLDKPGASTEMHKPTPQARTADYYASRPCARFVATACRIYAEHLLSGGNNLSF